MLTIDECKSLADHINYTYEENRIQLTTIIQEWATEHPIKEKIVGLSTKQVTSLANELLANSKWSMLSEDINTWFENETFATPIVELPTWDEVRCDANSCEVRVYWFDASNKQISFDNFTSTRPTPTVDVGQRWKHISSGDMNTIIGLGMINNRSGVSIKNDNGQMQLLTMNELLKSFVIDR